MTGAEMILLSSTMAKRRPTFFDVASPNLRAPAESNLKEITGRPPWSKLCCASTRFSPATSALFSTRSSRPLSSSGRSIMVGGTAPTPPGPCTMWNVSFASALILSLISWTSTTPGTCTTMRSSPWRTMVGSSVPVSSMRRRITSIDCSTVRCLSCVRPASVYPIVRVEPSALSSIPSVSTDLSCSRAVSTEPASRRVTVTALFVVARSV